jgi:hypothetical protein
MRFTYYGLIFSYNIAEYWEFKNVGEKECLDVTFKPGRRHYRLYVEPCKNIENQKWRILGSGSSKKLVQNSTVVVFCLESGGGDAAVKPCTDRAAQQWRIEGDHIIDKDGKCLDVDHKMGYMRVNNCNETKDEAYRKWEQRKLP